MNFTLIIQHGYYNGARCASARIWKKPKRVGIQSYHRSCAVPSISNPRGAMPCSCCPSSTTATPTTGAEYELHQRKASNPRDQKSSRCSSRNALPPPSGDSLSAPRRFDGSGPVGISIQGTQAPAASLDFPTSVTSLLPLPPRGTRSLACRMRRN